MCAIYKKELRAYLTSMTGYIFMAVLLAVTSLYYVANCLVGGYPVFGAVLSSVYFVLLIIVPVLTMRSMAEEKRQKTDQLLMTAPVSLWKIVLGKYLAMVTIFLIPMAVICLYPLILLQFGSVSLPMAYTAILGYTLFGAACLAIGLFLSAVTESQVIAAVLTFGVLFFLNMASGIANVIGASGILASVFNALCIYQPFINFVQGMFDLTGVIYYVTVIALALFLTVQLLQKKHGTYRVSMVAFGCVAVVLVNLIAGQLPSRYLKYDVSSQKLFTTGEQTEEILKGLDEDITLYLIAQQGSEDATLQELLERYEGLSSHIKVETKDPVLYPNFVSQYTSENLSENSVLVVGQNRSKAVDYYDIYQYSMDYSTYSSTLSSFDGEGQITSAIAYVTAEDMPVVYTLTGHDETDLSTTVTSSIEKENIELKSLSLLTEEAVPEDAKAVIIYGAISDISEDEKNKLEAYMEQGGQVVLMLGYTEKDTPNLDSLLSDYGITLAGGLVLESDSQHHIPNYPYYLLPDIQSSGYTSDVSSRYVLMAFAQGMTESAEHSDNLTYESLLTTSDQSYSKTDLQSENLSQEENDIAGPFDLGAVVTKITEEGTEAKLVVFSSETLLDEQVDSMVSGGNSTLFMNVMSQLVDHESTVSIEPKSMSTEYLTVNAGSAIFWGLLTIILIPLLLLATGGVIWFGRRKR
ncbi:Gldg family protein [Anaerosacchariphilus sp. NSJ-68]|uniref:Gldg family protein n=2 Tax=Lachnospiraceae TaxID=186803 RepID=A0A923RPH9_9FIRM|nr:MULTISPECIES: Gldg family protein [Lachnospiraceae]MBC5660355.1 Gldg family protein [Anaerosacchariphilus hominis]MBC5697797.1 Gldg family protein [Roseburia difficilis]